MRYIPTGLSSGWWFPCTAVLSRHVGAKHRSLGQEVDFGGYTILPFDVGSMRGCGHLMYMVLCIRKYVTGYMPHLIIFIYFFFVLHLVSQCQSPNDLF